MSEFAYIAYYRVSTEKQGASGLGLEAQRMAISEYLTGSGGLLVAEYTEIESGRRKDRPQLLAALEACKKRRATLVISKLDRLARSVAFVSALIESGVKFVVADMPQADIAFLQMASVFAELEARKISERTRAALAAAKARGTRLGWSIPTRVPEQRAASKKGNDAIRERSKQFALNTLPVIESIQSAGVQTLAGVAKALNDRGVRSARGGRWHSATVWSVLAHRAPA